MNSKTVLVTAVLALSLGGVALAAGEHQHVMPGDVKWSDGPPSLPKGIKLSVLYGDPSKDGAFAMRALLPAGYHIPLHTHPKPEVVTIISGTALLGYDAPASKDKAKSLPAGGFFVTSPGTAHYVYTDQETVVQINTNGPWGITYVNESEDPRKSN